MKNISAGSEGLNDEYFRMSEGSITLVCWARTLFSIVPVLEIELPKIILANTVVSRWDF